MFGGDDEDRDFLSPSGGAKLASLFGLDQQSNQGNESFQYTAPKQPRKSSNTAPASQKLPPPPSRAPAVLLATAVQAFRYINGQYVKQGKLGAAALGNHTTKEYKLLLYLSQQKQVATAKIHPGFVLTVQPNYYCTFYDDQRQNWSLMFESEKASLDFCKEVCLAKVNSAACLDSVVVQDLSPGEGQGVEHGDSLEVVYTGWLLQNHTFGLMFDTNQNKDKLLRLKIGAGKVIKGWEEGMLGMKKAGHRLIVIPPHLAYGSKGVPNRIPPDSTLIFEAELRRVKFSKDSGSDRASLSSAAPSPAPSPAPSVENLTPEPAVQTTAQGQGRAGEPPLRAKSNSLSEQLANPDATKAKLISRMAKMGQPMLPFLTGVSSQPESSDSELEDTTGSRVKDQPVASSPVQISTAPPAAPQVHPHSHTAPPSTLLPVMTTVAALPGLSGNCHAFQPYSYTQTSVAPSQLQPVGQVFPAQTVPYMGSSDVNSFLMTEARQHNTEIRLAVGKVTDKVDQLASKIDDLQRQGSLSVGVSNMSMETTMIMHSIQRIMQENECLKKEIFEKSSRIEEQNRKIGDLINQNQRYVEQSNLLQEQRNDSLKSTSEHNQARLLQAEQDKPALSQDLGSGQVRLTEDLASSTARLSQLQLEATSHQQKAMELQSKLSSVLLDNENHCQCITSLETQLEELKETAERAQAQYRSEKQRRKEMELRVNGLDEELQDLKTDKEALERTLLERKKKWQVERQHRDEEVEELRRSNQQELNSLRSQLRKARASTDQATSEQLSQLQAELEEDWKRKCEQMLMTSKEQHRRDLSELTEQRDALQDKLSHLQEKFTLLKQSRESEEQSLSQQREQMEELQALQEKYTALEKQGVTTREKLERKVTELEKKLTEQEGSGDTAAEVKRVMNGVFHSLRGEFDLSESYSGQAVLAVIVTTIKNVTLELLSGTRASSSRPKREEEEEESDNVTHTEEQPDENVHVNGEGRVREEGKEEEGEHVAEMDSHHNTETQTNQKVSQEKEEEIITELKDEEIVTESKDEETVTESKDEETVTESKDEAKVTESKDEETVTESKDEEIVTESKDEETAGESETQSQIRVLLSTDLHPASSSELQTQQDTAAAAESDRQQEQEKCSKTTSRDADPESAHPQQSLPPEDGQDTAAVSNEVDDKSMAHEEKMDDASQNIFGPPSNPPPPPDPLQNSSHLPGGISEENGTEPFFQITTPVKCPTAASEDEEEELSLKGCPPPAPLFGDDEDDDDLDWLN
ncbi:FK506-binding protein 15 isoform X1 [Solea senegalensis]|uniref:peptidylprolyl isomerase n=1 Tax=Solea senegalensis TaxID=28829 RepID=A0AAV6QFT0_SOLSE|nr:FK506-binding protein 15 isoform X1 [Solea senegalensis]KAG7488889.1 FK506-binding protein 15 isoform X1 [Solea senegalensis]